MTMHAPNTANQPQTLAALTALLLAGSVLCVSSNAFAGEELTSMRSAGMGNNIVAGAGANAAIFHNPSGLALANVYAIEMGYDTVIKDGQNSISVSAADSQTNGSVAGGFAYTYTFDRGTGPDRYDKWRDHDFRAALAVPLIPNTLSLGVGTHYMNYVRAELGVPGERNAIKHKGFTMDVGLSALLNETIFIGVVAQDLLKVDGATSGRDIRGGLGFLAGPVRVQGEYGVNLHEKHSTHHFGFGAEAMLQSVALRAGYRWIGPERFESSNDHELSFGAGYRSRSFGIDAVYRQEIQRAPSRWIGVSMLFFVR